MPVRTKPPTPTPTTTATISSSMTVVTNPSQEVKQSQEVANHRKQRLTEAFLALEKFPALAASRDQALELLNSPSSLTGETVAAIESDVALMMLLLREANDPNSGTERHVDSIVDVLDLMPRDQVRTIVAGAETFDFFRRSNTWNSAPERFRLHALAAQRAADRLAREISYKDRDRLMVTALLHDIGKLALMHAYSSYPRQVHGAARTPEERITAERRVLGVDHALVGGVIARRWGLPKSIWYSIERHHSDDHDQDVCLLRLADMLAHYTQGAPTAPAKLVEMARIVGIGPTELRSVLYDLPYAPQERPRALDPCPLSGREVDVLKRLGEGKVYKQIAGELDLSTSTVRTHLHNIYGKLGAVDRAQAVLLASARGWI